MAFVAIGGVAALAVVAVAVWLCLQTGRPMRELAHAGAAASAATAAAEDLSAQQAALLARVAQLGFAEAPPVRVTLPGKAPAIYANARRHDGVTWFRSLSIEPGDEPSSTFLTHYAGGTLVTGDLASLSVDPNEVVQCLPGAPTGELLALHDRALAAMAARGARPTPLGDDLARLIEHEWHTEARLMLGAGPVAQMGMQLATGSLRPTPEITDRDDLDEVARRLGGP